MSVATKKRTACPKIHVTKNYRLFKRDPENRETKSRLHRNLRKSMQKYGFLSCLPIVVRRAPPDKRLVVKEGQHRLEEAERLGLPVYYIETDIDFDIAIINTTAKTWSPRDYAEKYARNGHPDYQEALDFAKIHRLPIGSAFALLAGYATFKSIKEDFLTGHYHITDREWADRTASLYRSLVSINSELHHQRFLESCMALTHIDEFDADRLIRNAKRCRDRLQCYGTRDANLTMLEEVYNFHHSQMFGLKVAAVMAMRGTANGNGNGNGKHHKNGAAASK
jgi:hypothetical protein